MLNGYICMLFTTHPHIGLFRSLMLNGYACMLFTTKKRPNAPTYQCWMAMFVCYLQRKAGKVPYRFGMLNGYVCMLFTTGVASPHRVTECWMAMFVCYLQHKGLTPTSLFNVDWLCLYAIYNILSNTRASVSMLNDYVCMRFTTQKGDFFIIW